MKKPVALIIMDGFGESPGEYGNAIKGAKTPNYNRFRETYPHTLLGASGMDVGLPEGQMGNSEVGHTNIGAGRVVYQELTRITKSIIDGDFFENPSLREAMENCKKNGSALHLIGLLSDGGVHSHNTHLYALLEMAKQFGLEKVFVHCITDGRDVPPKSGAGFVEELLGKMSEIGIGEIATISGRYYAMDRDNRWDRVELAYKAIVRGEGINLAARDVLPTSYKNEVTDEFVVPAVCNQHAKMQTGDSAIFFNFRPDRAREITRSLVDPDFESFACTEDIKLHYVCMTQYDATMPNVYIAFRPTSLESTLGEYIAKKGLTQLRIAETEKYAHVTFFFNGGVEAPYEGEDRVLIPSPKVDTYDLKPEMSAYEVTDEMLKRLDSGKYDLIVLNYANCDMVGHTGVYEAAVKSAQTVDECVGKVVAKVLSMGGIALITADHGNAEQMFEADGSPFTAHSTSPVPFIVVGMDGKMLPPGQGRLADIAPTILGLLGLDIPPEMEGRSIIIPN